MAFVKAVPASEMPMTSAMEPVTVGGRTFSILSMPKRLTIRPATIETKPEQMIPNCACPINESDTVCPNVAPVMPTMAAM